MPSITFGFVSTFKHRGEQSEIKTRSCPVNRSHIITNGNFCPDCGTMVVESKQPKTSHDQHEVENLIRNVWGKVSATYLAEFFHSVKISPEYTILILCPFSRSAKRPLKSEITSSGINVNEISRLSGLATECFQEIAKLIDREHSEICMGADIQYYD